MMCNYNDCGWCYAPDDLETNANAGACNKPKECPQSTKPVVTWEDIIKVWNEE